MADPKGGTGSTPPLTRRDQIVATSSGMSSPNSSFGNGSLTQSSSANASFSSSGIERTGSSKKSKEDAKRDKEEEKVRKKDMKKEKERAKMSQSLGLPDGEKILHGTTACQPCTLLMALRVFMCHEESRAPYRQVICHTTASRI